jgi:DNA invertase Pin-like site-specific DNA recombinase
MPVEIRELVIRANVEEDREGSYSETRSNENRSEFNRMITELRELKLMIRDKNER